MVSKSPPKGPIQRWKNWEWYYTLIKIWGWFVLADIKHKGVTELPEKLMRFLLIALLSQNTSVLSMLIASPIAEETNFPLCYQGFRRILTILKGSEEFNSIHLKKDTIWCLTPHVRSGLQMGREAKRDRLLGIFTFHTFLHTFCIFTLHTQPAGQSQCPSCIFSA